MKHSPDGRAGVGIPTTPTITRTINVVACCLILADLLRALLTGANISATALMVADLGVLSALQLSYFRRPSARSRAIVGPLALVLQAVLVFLPHTLFSYHWIAAPGLLAGNALLTLPRTAGMIVFAVTVAAAGATQATVADALLAMVATTMIGLVTHGLPWLVTLVREVDSTRSELAALAVEAERVRMSRDLHDLLGYSLSAIRLKSELAHKLLADQPERAREELAEMMDIAGHALTDVRSLAHRVRPVSVRDATRSARAVLAAADITVDLSCADVESCAPLPEHVATVLAAVLREGVTNVLRHSKAERCRIALRHVAGRVCLDILNDGACGESGFADAGPISPHSTGTGNGVRNMAERVHEVGGHFTARQLGGEWFQLSVSIPLLESTPESTLTEPINVDRPKSTLIHRSQR